MRSCLHKEKVVITTETAVTDGYLSADKHFLGLLHISQVRRPICWSVCPPHGLPRLPEWVMISFLMTQTLGPGYLQFLLQCLQAWPATKKGGPEVFRSLCFCTEQEDGRAEATCHCLQGLHHHPNSDSPKSRGFRSFQTLSCIHK